VFVFFLELSKHKIYEDILMMLALTKFKYNWSCFIELIIGHMIVFQQILQQKESCM